MITATSSYLTNTLHSYWLYSPHCTFHACDSFILQPEVCTSVSLTYFFPLPTPSPLATTCLFSLTWVFCYLQLRVPFEVVWSTKIFVDKRKKKEKSGSASTLPSATGATRRSVAICKHWMVSAVISTQPEPISTITTPPPSKSTDSAIQVETTGSSVPMK